MGALEEGIGDGDDGLSSRKTGDGILASTMQRAASVDDLFAPMWRFYVQYNEGDASATPEVASEETTTVASAVGLLTSTRVADCGLGSSNVPEFLPLCFADDSADRRARAENQTKLGVSSQPKLTPSVQGFPVPVSVAGGMNPTSRTCLDLNSHAGSVLPAVLVGSRDRVRDAGVVTGSSSSYSSSQFSEMETGDVKPGLSVSEMEPHAFSSSGARGNLPPGRPSSHGGADVQGQSTSNSEDDQLGGVDERKQKRMLSNRESARRSRLRKQQHLDDLRAQVAQLRTDNNNILSKFNLASQRFVQLTDENRVLRSHAMDLSRQLHRLHQTAVCQHPGGLNAYGLAVGGNLDPSGYLSLSTHVHHISPYSQPLVPDLLN